MFRSLQLGRLFGIGIYVHWTWFLLPLWAWLARPEQAEQQVHFGFYLALLVAVFGCVILHELGHALMARRFGIETRDITLYPIGGVARLERMSEKPWEEFWIAVAGPAVNVVIVLLMMLAALLAALLGAALGGMDGLQEVGSFIFNSTTGQFLMLLTVINGLLVAFNMIPAFPMDGGRVLRALLSLWLGQLSATRVAARVGVVMALLVALAGILLPPLLAQEPPQFFVVILAAFVLLAGQMELRMIEMRHHAREEGTPPVVRERKPQLSQPESFTIHPTGMRAHDPAPGFLFSPRIAVYIWDDENGVWVKEPNPRLSEQ